MSTTNGTPGDTDATGRAPASDATSIEATARFDAGQGAGEARRNAPASGADIAAHAIGKASEGRGPDIASSFTEALAESKTSPRSDAPAAAGSHGHAVGAASATLAEPARAAPAAADTPVASSTVPVPVESPDFAAAFGLQVSTLARDGVQRAELHLNPSDMGPVSIQITLDGTQARVDFGADVAATRHAIEAGLPELASALRDAGFTLAGGGVAQHSRSNGGQADDAAAGDTGARRSAPAAVARLDAAAQSASRRAAAGGVDLYA